MSVFVGKLVAIEATLESSTAGLSAARLHDGNTLELPPETYIHTLTLSARNISCEAIEITDLSVKLPVEAFVGEDKNSGTSQNPIYKILFSNSSKLPIRKKLAASGTRSANSECGDAWSKVIYITSTAQYKHTDVIAIVSFRTLGATQVGFNEVIVRPIEH